MWLTAPRPSLSLCRAVWPTSGFCTIRHVPSGQNSPPGRLMPATTQSVPPSPNALWGPYLSERQWGTVREDYSASGDAWNYFPHDHARSRAYRWGEDGLAEICDQEQRLCLRSPCGTARPYFKRAVVRP